MLFASHPCEQGPGIKDGKPRKFDPKKISAADAAAARVGVDDEDADEEGTLLAGDESKVSASLP